MTAAPPIVPDPASDGNVSTARAPTRLGASRLAVLCLLSYFAIITTEGASRWVLSLLHLEPLLYVRELFPLAGMFLAMTMRGYGKRTLIVTIVGAQLAIAGAIGYQHWHSIPQVALGLKVFMPVMFGVIVYPAVARNWDYFRRGCAVLLLITTSGVFLNSLVTYPWIGADFTVGDVTVETSRDWTELDGRERLPGFTRASYDAAAHILFFTIITITGSMSRWRRLGVGVVSLGAVALTTSKSPFLALTLALVNFVMIEGWRLRRTVQKRGLAALALRAQVVIFAVAAVVLPLQATGFVGVLEKDTREESKFHFVSMVDRALTYWPVAMEHFRRHGSTVFGVGAGGVGSPLSLFSNVDDPVSCDNAFLYAYGVFGLLFFIHYFWFLRLAGSRRLVDRRGATVMSLIALVLCVQAVSSNTFEGPYDSFFIGMLIAHLTYGWRLKDSPLATSEPANPEPAAAKAVS